MPDRAVIDVKDLAVELGGRTALENVTLKVRPGEIVGLLGPNGAGKTTLLRAVLGLVASRADSVLLLGRPPALARPRVGYVPQRHEFAWEFPVSVAGAVLAGRVRAIGWLKRARAADNRAVAGALAQVRMTELAERPVGELSAGQRQRVLVARALALEPRLILLDEPFTGLDHPTRELLGTLLRRLRDEGVGVLLTTHDLTAAAGLCDRLCLLNRTVVADGSPGELTHSGVWLRAFGVTRSGDLSEALTADGVA